MKPAVRWSAFLGLRFAVAAVVVVLVAAAWHFGAFQAFRDAGKVQGLLDSWGGWAYVLYVVTFVLLMPFGVPAFLWVLPAGILWPFWVAYPLSLLGVMGGSSLGFLFARYFARDWVAARLPVRVARLDEKFSARGLRSVILFRLIFQLGAPTHWLLGLSRVGYGVFVSGTVIGAMPVVALVAWLGEDALHWVGMHLALAGAILVLAVVAGVVFRWVCEARAGNDKRLP